MCLLWIGLNVSAQDAFILPANEQTPSEQRREKQANSSSVKSLSAQDYKRYAYEDLKYYFNQHQWISIGINYEGYFDEQTRENYSYKIKDIENFGQQILNSLSNSSFKDSYIRKTFPSMRLIISKPALEILYSNPSIIDIYIDRMENFD